MLKKLKEIKTSKVEKEKALISLAIELCPQKKWGFAKNCPSLSHKGIDPINLKNKIFTNLYDIY